MAFCVNCGNPLNEKGVCENCASQTPGVWAGNQETNALDQETVKPDPVLKQPQSASYQSDTAGFQQSPGQQFAGQQSVPPQQMPPVPRAANPLVQDTLRILKAFFTPVPTSCLDETLQTSSPVFAVFGGVYLLFTALFMLVPLSGGMFFSGLVLAAIVFFGSAGLVQFIYSMNKKQVHFLDTMNLVSAAFIPAALGVAAGTIVSTFWLSGGIFLLLIGTIMSLIMVYEGMQKQVPFDKKPIWIYMAGCAVLLAVVELFISRVIWPAILEEILYSIIDYTSWF